ncbi:MAG: metalloregulator ArsR/SmtB family transcription factor [Planctomycetota bacterium]|nr:metalloregulator ArsR/SmtB family transcription factor [Planctomycetota bacterium]
MNRRERRRLELRADVIKALAHASRLYIVEQLARQEHCVCELADGIGADLSTVSRHLGVLKAAGIIEGERRGKNVVYRLRTPCVLNFFGCIERVLAESAQATARVRCAPAMQSTST